MALDSIANLTRPGQVGATGDIDALHIEEYTGIVEGTIARRSALEGFVPMRTVRGTSVISNKAIGKSTLQAVTPGTTLDGTINKAGKVQLTVDTLVAARSFFPLLEVWQADYDARAETGREHGKKIAKFRDQAFFIQACKAAGLTASAYSGVDGAGHSGASQVTMAGSSDNLDPAKLFGYIADLMVAMEQKDVDPRNDDVVLAVKPAEYYTLLQNEALINTEYLTSMGNSVQAMVLKAYGVPVISSNNFPGGETISGHLLSNTANSDAYDGDFTKVVAVAFSPRALLAGETIPLAGNVFWNEERLTWMVHSYLAFGVTPDRAEFAGLIQKP